MLRLDINLLFTVINLIIIYVIIRKLLFKPVKKIIAQRETDINKQYEDAKATQDNADALKVQYEQALSGAQEEKAAVISDARVKAGAEYDRIVADARTAADKPMDDARKEAAKEQEKTIKQAKDQIEELVVAATAKVVASGQGEAADRELYNQFLTKTGENK